MRFVAPFSAAGAGFEKGTDLEVRFAIAKVRISWIAPGQYMAQAEMNPRTQLALQNARTG